PFGSFHSERDHHRSVPRSNSGCGYYLNQSVISLSPACCTSALVISYKESPRPRLLTKSPVDQTRLRKRKGTGLVGHTSTLWSGMRCAGCRRCPASGMRTNVFTDAPSRDGFLSVR